MASFALAEFSSERRSLQLLYPMGDPCGRSHRGEAAFNWCQPYTSDRAHPNSVHRISVINIPSRSGLDKLQEGKNIISSEPRLGGIHPAC
jgi:hypothetical protein